MNLPLLENLFQYFAERIPWLQTIDENLSETVRGASTSFLLKMVGRALSFVFGLLLARILGADGVGVYQVALSVMTTGSIIGRLGIDLAAVRFTATHATKDEWSKVAGLFKNALLLSGLSSVVVTAVLFIGAEWLVTTVYKKPHLLLPVRVMVVGLLPLSWYWIVSNFLRGLKRVAGKEILQEISVTGLSIVLLPVLAGPFDVMGAVYARILAIVLTLLLGLWLWQRATPKLRALKGDFERRVLLSSSLPLFWAASTSAMQNIGDTLLLAVWVDTSEVGIYAVASRVAGLTFIVMGAVNTMVAPQFAALYASGKHTELAKLVHRITRLVILVTSPILLIILSAPRFILGLFGAEFTAGSTTLIILALGTFSVIATGPISMLLSMTGNERAVRNAVISGNVLNIALLVLLTPAYGIIGAAVASLSSRMVTNVLSIYYVKRHLGINVWKLQQ